jgi:hypothetical protein
MKLFEFFCCIVCLMSASALAGCGQSDGIETAHVRGIVKLDGRPYGLGGSVIFQPELRGKMAHGTIQNDGSFVLTTFKEGDGAAVGKNKVAVKPPVPKFVDEFKDAPATKSPLPAKYGSPVTSNLVYDVKPGEKNEFVIELTSK